jgi:hypothetical protein
MGNAQTAGSEAQTPKRGHAEGRSRIDMVMPQVEAV